MKKNILFQLSSDVKADMSFNSATSQFILDVGMPKCDVMCCECKNVVIGVPYFCKSSRRFFCKECLLKSKHSLKYQTLANPEHRDYPVVVRWSSKGSLNKE